MKNDRIQYLLWQLASECNEVAHRASKAAQFGLDETQPEQPYTNKERLTQENTDLIAVIGMCMAEGIIANPSNKAALRTKQAKVEACMEYARSCGMLETALTAAPESSNQPTPAAETTVDQTPTVEKPIPCET